MKKIGLLILASLLLTACPKAECIEKCGVSRKGCNDFEGKAVDRCIQSYDKCVDACGKK